MKYEVYIEDKNLIFEPKRGAIIAIPLDEITCFAIDKITSDAIVPTMIGGKISFITKKNPSLFGTIVVGLTRYTEIMIQKKYYKKIINKYRYIKIKHVKNVFRVSEALINLNIHFDQVLIKEVIKLDNEDNEFYHMTKFFE